MFLAGGMTEKDLMLMLPLYLPLNIFSNLSHALLAFAFLLATTFWPKKCVRTGTEAQELRNCDWHKVQDEEHVCACCWTVRMNILSAFAQSLLVFPPQLLV
jgi:hypothetical protein